MVNMELIKEILVENVVEYASKAEKYDRMKAEYNNAIRNADHLITEHLLNCAIIKELKSSLIKKDEEIKSLKRKYKKKCRRLKAEMVYIKAVSGEKPHIYEVKKEKAQNIVKIR